MRTRFCYSELTFNFKLKSHAHFSGYDRRDKRHMLERSLSLRAECPQWRSFVAGHQVRLKPNVGVGLDIHFQGPKL